MQDGIGSSPPYCHQSTTSTSGERPVIQSGVAPTIWIRVTAVPEWIRFADVKRVYCPSHHRQQARVSRRRSRSWSPVIVDSEFPISRFSSTSIFQLVAGSDSESPRAANVKEAGSERRWKLYERTGRMAGMIALAIPEPLRQPRKWSSDPWWRRRPQVYFVFPICIIVILSVLLVTSPKVVIAWARERWRSRSSRD